MGESRKEKPVVPVLAIPALHSTPAKKCKHYRAYGGKHTQTKDVRQWDSLEFVWLEEWVSDVFCLVWACLFVHVCVSVCNTVKSNSNKQLITFVSYHHRTPLFPGAANHKGSNLRKRHLGNVTGSYFWQGLRNPFQMLICKVFDIFALTFGWLLSFKLHPLLAWFHFHCRDSKHNLN